MKVSKRSSSIAGLLLVRLDAALADRCSNWTGNARHLELGCEPLGIETLFDPARGPVRVAAVELGALIRAWANLWERNGDR